MRIAVLNSRAPAQTTSKVNSTTPAKPAQGCQVGIVTGDAILKVITIGVKGGINDMMVAKLERGSFRTGIMMNMGIIIGNIAGNESD